MEEHVAEFAKWLKAYGYRRSSIKLYVAGARRFARWAPRAHIRILPDAIGAVRRFRTYLKRRGALRCSSGSLVHGFTGARHFVQFLLDVGLAAPPPTEESAEPALLVEFSDWMRQHRGVRERSLEAYMRHIPHLLDAVGHDLEQLDARTVRRFVLRRADRPHARRSAQEVVSTVRGFLRFLAITGRCSPDLVEAAPRLARWKRSRLPRHLRAEDLDRIIRSCDPATPVGSRDRAVLLLLARLGLRASDVVAMRRQDVAWEEGTVAVTGKGRRQILLPLTQEVGDALLHYLEHARPRVVSDRLFLRVKAPAGPLTRAAVSGIVSEAMRRADVRSPSRGSHVFRHTAAALMLRQGVSMEDIGAVLRHALMETTAIYAKVDVDLLREVVMPWPKKVS